MTTRAVSRRHGAELEDALLDAARAELAETGYARLTMEGVAARARTSKPVLYRRWPTLTRLVFAVLAREVPAEGELPDTGTLRGDLIALMRGLARRYDDFPGDVMPGVLSESVRDPELAELARAYFNGSLLELTGGLLTRAVERGLVDAARLTPRVVRLPLDLLRSELFLTGAGASDDYVRSCVDEVMMPLLTGPRA